jgi:hypothetical protein
MGSANVMLRLGFSPVGPLLDQGEITVFGRTPSSLTVPVWYTLFSRQSLVIHSAESLFQMLEIAFP